MPLPKINPTTTNAWQQLQEHYKDIQKLHMKDLFASDSERVNKMTTVFEDIYVDISKNRITDKTLELLLQLAEETQLKEAIHSVFSGEKINETENRAVLHSVLRSQPSEEVLINGENIVPEVLQVKNKIREFSEAVIQGKHKGYTGKSITTVVNVGIGGSDLGPSMVVDALQFYKNHLDVFFVNNVDGDHVNEIIKKLDPETTLFVIVSKTFTTQETLSNANTLREWFLKHANEEAIQQHFAAVSTNIEKVLEFGIAQDSIFPMWNWVGGRYSLWSAVGMIISLSVGYDNFEKLLEGAHKIDTHFKTESFDKNIPVILALIGIWYNNFFDAESQAIIPYSQYLNQFPSYLQQTDMESNGKYVDRNGDSITYQTGTIIWGAPGTNSQHSFFQLLHQGTKLIPTDFIGFKKSLHGNKDHQDKLFSNFIGQTQALLLGKTKEEAQIELEQQGMSQDQINALLPYKVFKGNKPTNTIIIDKLTPESLGKLIAIYEHKIFVQGIIWNVFSFDQFGVELGKKLANTILKDLNDQNDLSGYDSSTTQGIKLYNT